MTVALRKGWVEGSIPSRIREKARYLAGFFFGAARALGGAGKPFGRGGVLSITRSTSSGSGNCSGGGVFRAVMASPADWIGNGWRKSASRGSSWQTRFPNLSNSAAAHARIAPRTDPNCTTR